MRESWLMWSDRHAKGVLVEDDEFIRHMKVSQ